MTPYEAEAIASILTKIAGRLEALEEKMDRLAEVVVGHIPYTTPPPSPTYTWPATSTTITMPTGTGVTSHGFTVTGTSYYVGDSDTWVCVGPSAVGGVAEGSDGSGTGS